MIERTAVIAVFLFVVALTVVGLAVPIVWTRPTPEFDLGEVVHFRLTQEQAMVIERRCGIFEDACTYYVRDRWHQRRFVWELELRK